jgi:HEAT repeat protein
VLAVSFETFLQELADPMQPLAATKLATLSNIGPDDASRFGDALQALPEERRERLLEELVDLAEDNVELNFDAVFLDALRDADPQVRRTAVQGLWEHEGRDLIGPLIDLLRRDEDAGVRADAALALGRFVLRAEFDTLAADDTDRIESALRDVFDDVTEIAEVRGRALEALGARSLPWVRELIERAYDDDDRRLRLSAVHAMGRSCDVDWLSTLLLELESEDAEMRFEAAGALGSIEDEEATGPLVGLLYDEDLEVRMAAIGALGEIGGPLAKGALEELLAENDELVHDAVVEALAEADFADDPIGFSARE